jgi:hypothetical protein
MAATKIGNTWFIPATSTGVLGGDNDVNKRLSHVFVTPTASNAHFEITDPVSGNKMFQVKISGAGDTAHFSMEVTPMYFPNGMEVSIATNCDTMLVLHPGSGGSN